MPRIRLLVVDLDHTLFDWVGAWAVATRALLDDATRLTGIAPEALAASLAGLHRARGSTEPDDPLGSLDCLASWIGRDARRRGLLRTVWLEARATGLGASRRLPGVADTLAHVHARGSRIVVCSESPASAIDARLEVLGLAAHVDAIVPAGHPCDASVRRRVIGVRAGKPEPDVLHAIVEATGVPPHETVCVGDHLHKDVGMAQAAGVHDVWAAYGLARSPADLALLSRLAHWGPGDVDARRFGPAPTPTMTLERSMDELLSLFDFESAP